MVEIQSGNPSVKLAKNEGHRRVTDVSLYETRTNRKESETLLNHYPGFSRFEQSGEELISRDMDLHNLLFNPAQNGREDRVIC